MMVCQNFGIRNKSPNLVPKSWNSPRIVYFGVPKINQLGVLKSDMLDFGVPQFVKFATNREISA